jgi:2'-5' RNA ligase
MERKRVFIGLPADDALRAAAAAFRHSHGGLKARWIRPEYLHVTMVPPWELPDPEPVCMALEVIASSTAPVPVRFDEVSAGPDPRRPRLLWATGAAPDSLCTLASQLSGTFGDGKEAQRGFLLHLTIARLNRQEARSSTIMKLHEPVGWDALLDKLCLYESILKPEGAVYRELCRFPLRESFKK